MRALPGGQGTNCRQFGLLLVGFVLFAAAAIGGCSARPPVSSESKKPVEGPAKPKVPSKPSVSEQAYAQYIKTLSPKQVALRESLNPDALAAMDEAKMAEAFAIRADEVVADGKIDPQLYAEAFAARLQAMNNAGISEIEYAKWGGLDSFGTDVIQTVAVRYVRASPAFMGGSGLATDSVVYSLTVGSIGDGLMQGKTGPKPTERYHCRTIVKPDSAYLADGSDDHIRFTLHTTDNMFTDVSGHAKTTLTRLTSKV
jgi:hypothetical protein